MEEKKYITQLTAQDLKELAAAANPTPGFCIRIEKVQGQLQIGIDENALRVAINGFYRNGGCSCTAANCTSISFDPPS